MYSCRIERIRTKLKIQYPIYPIKPKENAKCDLTPFLFLDDGKGFRIVQNGSRQERMSST